MLVYESKWVETNEFDNGFYNINQMIVDSKTGQCCMEKMLTNNEGNIERKVCEFYCSFSGELVKLYNLCLNLFSIFSVVSILLLSYSIYQSVINNLLYLLILIPSIITFICGLRLLFVSRKIQFDLQKEMLDSPEYKEIKNENDKVFLSKSRRKI